MTQLSRERLEQYAFDDRMCNVNDEIREMARRLLAAEAREPVPVMYKGVELLKKDGLELIRDGLAVATELEAMCMAGALLSATSAQPVAVPDGCVCLRPDEIERHTLTAGECPSIAKVMLVSSINRLNARRAAPQEPTK